MSLARRYTTVVLLAAVAAVIATAASSASAGTALYATTRPLEAELDAPLSPLFARARHDASFAVHGTFAYTDPGSGRRIALGDVKVEVRGNTSRRSAECRFPKLKLTLRDDDASRASLFGTSRTVRIGTHCGDAPDGDLTSEGRWPNEKEPFREAFVYRLLEAMGVPSVRARPARIRYVDPAAPAGHQDVVRDAFFVEDPADAAHRFGAGEEVEPFTTAHDLLAADDAARLAFAEAMIGNFDWCLKFSPGDRYRCDVIKPLWNINVYTRPGGRALPIMYDFDLSGMVTGSHPWYDRVFSDVFLGPGARRQTEVLAQVQRTRTLFSRGELDRTRAYFAERRAAAYDALAQAPLDGQGRTFAREYLDAFFNAIEGDDNFYVPVVASPGVRPYLDAERSQTACGESETVPPGTPVGGIQARAGTLIQVPILDALWHWTNRCPAVRRGPLWIDANAVTQDFPKGATETQRR